MLLSEAIEKGSVGRKRCNGDYFDQNGGCCILGAAALGAGYEVSERDFENSLFVGRFLEQKFPIILQPFGNRNLYGMITQWNDQEVDYSSILAAIKEFEKEHQPPAPDAHALGEREE